jgi:Predicted protein tyrosine phosphatase
MEILVKSRYYFESLRGTPDESRLFEHIRVISVNSVRVPEEPPFSRQYWDAANVLVLRFDDVDDANSGMRECANAGMARCRQGEQAMTEADAEAIARFAEVDDPRPIMVHCTAGISRSGAIGACLNEYYNKKRALNEDEHALFWTWHRSISPNLHVMKLLWKRLGLGELKSGSRQWQ